MKKIFNIRKKIVKINGVKVKLILPESVDIKTFPKELRSKQNHPKGTLVNEANKLVFF